MEKGSLYVGSKAAADLAETARHGKILETTRSNLRWVESSITLYAVLDRRLVMVQGPLQEAKWLDRRPVESIISWVGGSLILTLS